MSPEPPPLGRYRRWLLGLLVIVWLSAFVATHIPPASIPRAGVGDWVLHTLGYFVLGSLLLATAAAYGLSARRRALLVLVLLAAYGAMDEVTQELVSRHASVWD